ncbi:unnamed protein product [Brachionus calyciflorus]|uniref:Uncharacterized protein n=1 Tax=Brachionus calyciflorus TaxID=104777 RepID=A0A814IMK3_9BILA|nr:unnamed protein product [Brachionus calyciflorus]
MKGAKMAFKSVTFKTMGLSACGGIGIRIYLDELDIYKKPKTIDFFKIGFISTAPYGALMGHYAQKKFSFAQSLFGAFICVLSFYLMDDEIIERKAKLKP